MALYPASTKLYDALKLFDCICRLPNGERVIDSKRLLKQIKMEFKKENAWLKKQTNNIGIFITAIKNLFKRYRWPIGLLGVESQQVRCRKDAADLNVVVTGRAMAGGRTFLLILFRNLVMS